MDAGLIHKKYGEFYDILKKLGEFPLSVVPELKYLNISNAQIQSAYRDINNEPKDVIGGRMSIVDYLCLVSTRYLVLRSEGKSEKLLNKELMPDVRNMLRLFMKKPEYLFYELRVKPDKNYFTNLTGLWFDFYFNELNKSNG